MPRPERGGERGDLELVEPGSNWLLPSAEYRPVPSVLDVMGLQARVVCPEATSLQEASHQRLGWDDGSQTQQMLISSA